MPQNSILHGNKATYPLMINYPFSRAHPFECITVESRLGSSRYWTSSWEGCCLPSQPCSMLSYYLCSRCKDGTGHTVDVQTTILMRGNLHHGVWNLPQHAEAGIFLAVTHESWNSIHLVWAFLRVILFVTSSSQKIFPSSILVSLSHWLHDVRPIFTAIRTWQGIARNFCAISGWFYRYLSKLLNIAAHGIDYQSREQALFGDCDHFGDDMHNYMS